MLISNFHKVAFIKNPKTASQAITEALTRNNRKWFEHGRQHDHPHELPSYIRVEQGWKIFCFVRCPWDRMISSYEYIRSLPKRSLTVPFDEWVMDETAPKFPQCYIRAVASTHVYRFENLDQQFRQMLDDLGIPRMNTIRVNVSRRRSWAEYYTRQELIDRVADVYCEDIRRYGYEFPSWRLSKDPH